MTKPAEEEEVEYEEVEEEAEYEEVIEEEETPKDGDAIASPSTSSPAPAIESATKDDAVAAAAEAANALAGLSSPSKADEPHASREETPVKHTTAGGGDSKTATAVLDQLADAPTSSEIDLKVIEAQAAKVRHACMTWRTIPR